MSAMANLKWLAMLTISFGAYCGCTETMTTPKTLDPTSDTLDVSTWNIGYAGLGAESDFLKDGGERILPPSRSAVKKNVRGILNELGKKQSDVILLQEIASRSAMTRFVGVERRLHNLFADRFYWFHPDTRVPFLPPPVGIAHGLGIVSDKTVKRRSIHALPKEDDYAFGWLDRDYALQIIELESQGPARWVVINMHLAAFDSDGAVRKSQAKVAFDIADAYHRDGRHVVIGGDWNMELAIADTPRPTTEEYPFWLVPFDETLLPQGWKLAVDRRNPTVRTLIAPYRPGETYTAIIDGFAYSPNVVLEEIETEDTSFEMADHMPVKARFRASMDRPIP